MGATTVIGERRPRRERGFTYIALLIAVAIIVAVTQLGDNLLALYAYVSKAVTDVAAAL